MRRGPITTRGAGPGMTCGALSRGQSARTSRSLPSTRRSSASDPEVMNGFPCFRGTRVLLSGRLLNPYPSPAPVSSQGSGLACSDIHSSFRNSSTVMPASRIMPPMVYALTGSWRGIVTITPPFDITMCLEPSRATVNPAFSRVRTARRCGTPESFGTGQTETSTSRMFDSRSDSVAAATYSRMASRMLSSASASVAPWDQQPGNPGHETAKPSSEASKATL